MIDKINYSIKIIEKSLIDEHSDYEYGLLVGHINKYFRCHSLSTQICIHR